MKEKDTLPNTFIDIQSDLLQKTTVSFINISHIAKKMHRKFFCNVKEMESRFAITIDESTIHGSPYLIIDIKCDVSCKEDVENVFLDLVELTAGVAAESIYHLMMASQHKAGMDDDFLKMHLISTASNFSNIVVTCDDITDCCA